RENRVVPVTDDLLESLVNAQHIQSFEEWVNGRLDLQKLLGSLEGEAEQIWKWRIEGYSHQEIARQLGMSANTVSMKGNLLPVCRPDIRSARVGIASKNIAVMTDGSG